MRIVLVLDVCVVSQTSNSLSELLSKTAKTSKKMTAIHLQKGFIAL